MDVRLDERLAGGVDVGVLEAILTDLDPRRVVFVGHDPDFSELLATIVGARDLPMKKGALTRIDTVRPLAPSSGTLRWLVPPDLLRRG
jgi:phosphohistidine phosphatase SixA